MIIRAVRASLRFSIAVFLILLSSAGGAQDRPALVVFSSNGIKAAMERLLPDAERTLGRRLDVRYSAATVLKQSIDRGEAFDAAILTPEVVDELMKSGRLKAGSRADVASIELAVGIKAGAPKTSVHTADGMKRRLLAARSLTWTEGGASSGATVAMLRALGIEEQLKPRLVLQRVPGIAAETVARGENELVFAPRSEIQTVQGVEVLGLFPPEYQRPVVMTAVVGAAARDGNAAAEFVRFLTGPRASAALRDAGMTPTAR